MNGNTTPTYIVRLFDGKGQTMISKTYEASKGTNIFPENYYKYNEKFFFETQLCNELYCTINLNIMFFSKIVAKLLRNAFGTYTIDSHELQFNFITIKFEKGVTISVYDIIHDFNDNNKTKSLAKFKKNLYIVVGKILRCNYIYDNECNKDKLS